MSFQLHVSFELQNNKFNCRIVSDRKSIAKPSNNHRNTTIKMQYSDYQSSGKLFRIIRRLYRLFIKRGRDAVRWLLSILLKMILMSCKLINRVAIVIIGMWFNRGERGAVPSRKRKQLHLVNVVSKLFFFQTGKGEGSLRWV